MSKKKVTFNEHVTLYRQALGPIFVAVKKTFHHRRGTTTNTFSVSAKTKAHETADAFKSLSTQSQKRSQKSQKTVNMFYLSTIVVNKHCFKMSSSRESILVQ